MPEMEAMVKLLRELNADNQLIALGGLMARKAPQEAADEAA